MTREEFIAGYCERSSVTWKELSENWKWLALPCDCGDPICDGWAMVSSELAADHMRLYGPHDDVDKGG